MNDNLNSSSQFTHVNLPVIDKPVFRMGLAGNYGIDSDAIRWAADQEVNYWLWGTGFKKVTDGIRQVIQRDRDKHIVAMLGWGFFGWQIRKSVEKALRKLNTDYLDSFKLGWLGKTSAYTNSTVDALLQLKEEGKIKSIGISIHDRKRAGEMALDSEIDLFMIRYNAKHPGAEQDIFPYLEKRNPAIVSYTAVAWGQLIKPLKKAAMPPWPGQDKIQVPPLTPELCYRFVVSNPHVHVVLTGPKTLAQLKQNLEIMQKGPLPPDELEWVREYGQLVRSQKRMDYV
ncbi:MAG: aldo/keto reductase [Deltaproteobacteria bacterium]|jgi:aryl-alcohol dehydrogenase-like predicted oxidoreductase|nr:aldo/keto reductase [Deltaproteobacteria bacterium]